MSDTFQVEVEYTDTYGGEANYCWVEREILTLPCGISDRELMRRCKAAVGLTGVRGVKYDSGDSIEFRPYRSCTVMFARDIY